MGFPFLFKWARRGLRRKRERRPLWNISPTQQKIGFNVPCFQVATFKVQLSLSATGSYMPLK